MFTCVFDHLNDFHEFVQDAFRCSRTVLEGGMGSCELGFTSLSRSPFWMSGGRSAESATCSNLHSSSHVPCVWFELFLRFFCSKAIAMMSIIDLCKVMWWTRAPPWSSANEEQGQFRTSWQLQGAEMKPMIPWVMVHGVMGWYVMIEDDW